jgi:AbiV family abortive infection protein
MTSAKKPARRQSPRVLSQNEIARAMELTLRNSKEIIGDAKILADADRPTRAYFLLHTAAEELSKFFIFHATARQLAQYKKIDWKRFWQRVRNHDSKIAHADVRFFAEDNEFTDSELAGIHLLTAYGTLPRNGALYVEIDPKENFRLPSQMNWDVPLPDVRAAVEALLRKAEKIGSSAKEFETSFASPPDKAKGLEMVSNLLERMMALGMTREQILTAWERLKK